MVKLYLDAGHGGKDSGANGHEIFEKNITLDLAKKIEKSLKANYKNVEVMMSRNTDVYLTLDERTDKANKWGANIFLSIHINAATNKTARGFSSYIYTDVDNKTISFQNVMHEEIFKKIQGVLGVEDDGKKQANFHVLRESKMTAILTENLFISNSADAALLKQDSFLQKIADGHVNGLEKFLGLEKNIPPPVKDEKLFQVICGTYSDINLAKILLEKLKKDGYDGYIKAK